ncbi:MAG TPA: DUF2252 domain-containing protein [Ilumatobacteraceae bacterium]|nr:DUF2252 domain-containing protein [Ilumatobacteraceae bacterium]
MPDSPTLEGHAHPTVEERHERGRAAREQTPRSSHADWGPAPDRPDPVDVLTAQDATRLQSLVPIRHGRMSVSPFTFYRGAAAIMAGDLALTPVSGLDAQLCGDAHLSNYGAFASAERNLVFDVNDFDETLPGPWEWDVKRLAASVALAGRSNGFAHGKTADAVEASVAGYRTAMAHFAEQATLDVWYAELSVDKLEAALTKKSDRKRLSKSAAKARSKTSLKAMAKLTERVDGALRIASAPPLIVPLRDLVHEDGEELRRQIVHSWDLYRDSIRDDRKALLERYRLVDIALKVVGVGSVGTRCMLALFVGRDDGDPLFLQVKEAEASVLEAHLAPSTCDSPGERVVQGQRLIQASGDIFLGWSSGEGGHHYYWRQFHDMKGSADVETMGARRLSGYATICGWTLAHAHARSSDPIAIAGYLGKGSSFDRALTEFAFIYADQNDLDYAAMSAAIDDGRITAEAD